LETFALSHPESKTFTQGFLFFSSINLRKETGLSIDVKSPAAHAQIIMMS